MEPVETKTPFPYSKPVAGAETSREFRAFLQLIYSFCKQFIAWYEQNMKKAPN